MKHISFTIIALWSLFMIVTNPQLKPSDNIFLFLLTCVSIMYSVINIVIYLYKKP